LGELIRTGLSKTWWRHAGFFDPKRVKVQATVTGFGTPAAKRTVTLLLNGRELQGKSVDVPENGRAQVEFLGLDAPYGFSKGEVRIDSADSLATDDHYYFLHRAH